MDLKHISTWYTALGLVLIDAVQYVSAGYCRYLNDEGEERVQYCDGHCCSSHYSGHICCGFNSGTIVGAGVGSVFFIGFIIMCVLYACCKQKIMSSYNNTCSRDRRNQQVHLQPGQVPTVSGSVEPTLPPPYDELPPPYYTNDIELGETSDETKEKKFPDHPPPAYTQFSENVK